MTSSITELENNLFLLLRTNESVTRDYVIKKLGCKPDNLNKIIQKHKKSKENPTGLIQVSKDKNSDHPSRHIYSLEISSFETLHESIKSHLELLLKIIDMDLKNLKKLKEQKPLFENVIKVETGIQLKIPRKQVKEILNNIGLILDNIYQTSFLINYYKTLNQIPQIWIKQADEDQKLCMQTYSNIIKKLRTIVGRKKLHQKALESQLFKHQMTLRRLDLHR